MQRPRRTEDQDTSNYAPSVASVFASLHVCAWRLDDMDVRVAAGCYGCARGGWMMWMCGGWMSVWQLAAPHACFERVSSPVSFCALSLCGYSSNVACAPWIHGRHMWQTHAPYDAGALAQRFAYNLSS